jgi:glycosyltransferase involved in cell wall biosynthesis
MYIFRGALLTLRQQASWFVFTLHDLIAFENPSYWTAGDQFVAYRQKLRILALLADCVLCISEVTASDAKEQLAPDDGALAIFPNPLTHLNLQRSPSVNNPRARPFVLVVGTDFRHKNLWESVQLFADTLLDHPLQPALVLAGPQVTDGGTLQAICELMDRDQRLAKRVELLGCISDEALDDLYQQATCCLYLSLQEGFGYIPYEAACFGCPSLVADTSVYQSLPSGIAVRPYSCSETRQALIDLVESNAHRAINLAYWRECVHKDHQRRPAMELVSCYQKVTGEPRRMQTSYWADFITMNLYSHSNQFGSQERNRMAFRQLAGRGITAIRLHARKRLGIVLRLLAKRKLKPGMASLKSSTEP